ncbi:transcription factor RelB isoform X2 [Hyperolius riggenbachi]|uniref:transcription factor RelB isoform X2 n=1 Tax=Hyperolius riggenbachi TaxID=752182 RepID=UPI0035A31A15
MREPGRTGHHYLASHDTLGSVVLPTHSLDDMDDVMELINSDNPGPQNDLLPVHISSDFPPRGYSNLIDTVIVNSQPAEPVLSVWEPCQVNAPPTLVITEQPKQRGMRFRYQCEGRSAGSILGEGTTDHTKTLPAIALENCEGIQEVHVSVCLVWKDEPFRVHPHGLVGKDCHHGICEIILHPIDGETEHSFSNLGIQCVRKKEIESAVQDRLALGIDPFNAGMWRHHEEVDLNVVRLCFQAWYSSPSGQRMTIGPVLSEAVYDKKSTNTSELKICRMNKECGVCLGGEEIYILCDKVQKEDIQVVFMEASWEARADFSQADVHRQIAIVLKTPPYRDLNIKDPTPVQVCLQRITDGIRSDGVTFTYLPRDTDSYGLCRKRPRLASTLDEYASPDPHGIEVRRKQPRRSFVDYLNPSECSLGCNPMPSLDYNGMNLLPAQFPLDNATFVEDTPTNLDIYSEWISHDLEEQPAPYNHFAEFPQIVEEDATASLVGIGLSFSVAGEQDQQYPDCSYPDDTRMGGC